MQTPSETDLGFPTKGSLKRVPFSNLLREIAAAKITGSLYLLNGETKKVVFFVDGRPTVVRSNLATEFLGQILTDQGMITQEQCDNTLEAIRRTGKKQGELLVEMGILSEGNLRYGLAEQLRIKLFEIFTWDEGRFQFKPGAEPGNAGTPPAGTTEALIIAAIQERFSDERAREVLRALASKYPGPNPKWTGDPAQLELLPEELYFLKCIDGSRTTDELLNRKPELEVPQASTLLLGLISAGVLEPLEAKLPRRLAPMRPNLTPPSIPEDQLQPSFEVASTIGEYDDTPLPSRLPDLGASSSKNPKVPILPTEDEEMFRGLNVDESIVTDSRNLVRAVERSAAAMSAKAVGKPVPAPMPVSLDPLGDESDFSDLQTAVDDDDDRPAPVPAASPKPDSGKHRLGPPPGLASLRKDTPKPAPAPVAAPARTPPPSPAPAPADDDDDDLPDLGDNLPDLGDDLGDEIEEIDEIDDEILDDGGEDDAAAPDDDGEEAPAYPTLDGDVAVSLSAAQAMPDDEEPEEPGDLGDLAGESGLGAVGDLGDDVPDDLLEGVDDDLLLSGDDADLGELEDLDEVDLDGIDDAELGDGELGDDDGELGDADAELGDDLGDGEFAGEDDGEFAGEDDGYADEPNLGSAESTFVGEVEGEGGGGDGMDAYGATRFSEAEAAMRDGDYDTAVALFEDAYNAGFDVAELHAHLAFCRYRSSGGDPDIANSSLELLDYAEGIDPGLAILHAYRGAIYVGLGMTDQARECIERALYLDPYCELAIEYRDSV